MEKSISTNKLFCFSIVLLLQLTCNAQEIEFCSSLNTSSERRFDRAMGIGLQYQQNISPKYKIGLGIHYNFNHAQFIDYPHYDTYSLNSKAISFFSHSKHASIRLNIQRIIKDNDNVSLTIGPEISYNYLWGIDTKLTRIDTLTTAQLTTFEHTNSKVVGIGFISKMEVKDFIKQRLSLCFTIRPEVFIGKDFNEKYGSSRVFFTPFAITEFQIGLKYNFKKM
jgi:hypothetical protein